jgi:small-conductance mechanosensitive channel
MQFVNNIFQFIWDNDYFRFLLIALLSFFASVIAKFIVNRVLKPLAKRTKTKIDDLFVKSVSSIVFYFVLFMGFKIGLQHFEFQGSFAANLIDTLLIVVFMLFIIRIIENYSEHWLTEWKEKTKTTADERLIPLLKKIAKAVVVILAVFFILSAWQVNITPLLTTAGIAGLAIGLAVKEPLGNIIGGIQLVLDKTFKVGDKIQLESGEMGIILDIGLRSTKLKTYDNEIIYIPNAFLANAKVKNFTQPDFSIRVNVNFGVVYGSDAAHVQKVVDEAVKAIDVVLEDPEPVVQFLEMSDFSLDFVARAWVQSYDQAYQTQRIMTEEIYKALNKAKIDIPFPTRTVYTKALD